VVPGFPVPPLGDGLAGGGPIQQPVEVPAGEPVAGVSADLVAYVVVEVLDVERRERQLPDEAAGGDPAVVDRPWSARSWA